MFYRGLKQEHVTGFSGRNKLLSSWIINAFLNETYERFKFNQSNQKVGESFDADLTALRNMAETCNFCSKQWATRYLETVSFSRSRTEMPGNGYFRTGSLTWRDVLTSAELRSARQLTSRRLLGNTKWSTGSTEGPMIFLRRSVNGAIELNPRLKKKTPSHESLRESSTHSLMFWRKSYVWRGVKDTMFAGKWITERVQKFGHGRENTLSKSRFWLFWLGLGCGLGADSQRLC